jgi:hypothetical protein
MPKAAKSKVISQDDMIKEYDRCILNVRRAACCDCAIYALWIAESYLAEKRIDQYLQWMQRHREHIAEN